MNSLDRLSLLFLSISFLGAAAGAYVLFQFYEVIHALLFMFAYFPVSVFVLKMISWQIDDLQKGMIVNAAILIYIQNTSKSSHGFNHQGVKA
jgi:hypothetical protein